MTHDNTAAVMSKYKSLVPKDRQDFADRRQVVFTLDHNVQDKSESNLKKYKNIEDFARTRMCDFYPAGRGIGHQVMVEEGYIFPFTLVVASDSHSNMYGGLGALGTPVVRTDAAAIWATGRTWWQVPPVSRVSLRGRLPPGASGKDVIIALCGLLNKDEVLNHAIEFAGDGVASLSIDERLTIANMTTEWGALAGVFPSDATTIAWLHAQADLLLKRGLAKVPSDVESVNGANPRLNKARINSIPQIQSDPNAVYAADITLDLSQVQPYVSGPNEVKLLSSAAELERQRIAIHKAYIVSCVNSRVSDLAKAASVLRGKKLAPGVELYIAAASSQVQAESEAKSDWQALIAAGATPLPAGCGPCVGLGAGLLQDNEVGISATNRNFKGRMGSKLARTYLASPEVVAYSALTGFISAPPLEGKKGDNSKASSLFSIRQATPAAATSDAAVTVIDGFPKTMTGNLVFLHKDNLNTDGIYAGAHTYTEGMSPEQMAAVCMENYDPAFVKITKKGDIIVGGFNFGTGSSREQAATALKFRGFPAVLAGSFSETYKRNAINNGLLVIEVPELVEHLKTRFGTSVNTVNTNSSITLDFVKSEARFDGRHFRFGSFGVPAQELIILGGLENWVRAQTSKQ